MAPTPRRAKLPNLALECLPTSSGMSHHAPARPVNELAGQAGLHVAYTHTSVVNWTRRGMTPRALCPSSSRALGERLGQPVDVAERGMRTVRENTAEAVRHAVHFWSTWTAAPS
ncbi:hypothetical protein Slala03_74220 [Streptomyces lavendulae subsp. lavendulae]|nr:hypothetical protein Slala03_74220 [Streptomyces lavendulae subsp. lavendulae]